MLRKHQGIKERLADSPENLNPEDLEWLVKKRGAEKGPELQENFQADSQIYPGNQLVDS